MEESREKMTARFRALHLVLLFVLLTCPFTHPSQSEKRADDGLAVEELVGHAVAEMLLLAEELIEQGYPEAAQRAIEICLDLDKETPGAGGLKEKIVARNRSRPAIAPWRGSEAFTHNLYDGKSLRGWKKSRGKWNATSLGILCDSGRSTATIAPQKAPKECAGFSLGLAFKIDPESEIDVVCGRSGRDKVGIRLAKSGAALFNFKTSARKGSPSKRGFQPNRVIHLFIVVDGGRISVTDSRREVAAGTFDDFIAGGIEFHARGNICLDKILFTPSQYDICMEQGLGALKKGDEAEAASHLIRARAALPGAALPAGYLAGIMNELGHGDEAARLAADFLRLSEGNRSHDSQVRRLARTAERIAAEAGESICRVEAGAAAWAKRIALKGEQALVAGEIHAAAAAEKALLVLESRGEVKEDFRCRLFLVHHGGEEYLKLFNGTDLTGWKMEAGEWTVEEGRIRAETGPGKKSLLSERLFPFDRYMVKTRQRGSGSYIDQGINFFVGKEVYSLRLYRFMKKTEITVSRGGNSVYYYPVPEDALTSTQWHDLDCLVHMNRLTVILDGKPLFTKILPAPPMPKIGLFATDGRRCTFGDILYRPVGIAGEYEGLLGSMDVPLGEVIECETLKEGEITLRGKVREQPFAYSGSSLADALDRNSKEGIGFRFKTVALQDAVLSLRYAAIPGRREAAASEEDTRLSVLLDGRELEKPLLLPFTPSINDFAYASIPVGDLAWGRHDVRLKCRAATGRNVLDRIVISDPGSVPEEETKIYDTPLAPHFKIRLSPGVQLPENAEEIFTLLETLRKYMVDHYGFEPADPLYYNLISRECWGDPHKGGYATGDNLYVPEETTARGLSTIMHEMSHNFDVGQGFNPPWFGEGKSFPIFLKFSKETGIRYRHFQRPLSRQTPMAGEDAFEGLEVQGENLLQYWGTSKFPYWGKLPDGRNLTSLGYRASNWFCRKLSEHLGEWWLRDYFILLRKEIEEKTYFMPRDRVEANSVIVDYFTRSSGRNVASFFIKKRFELIDIYDWDELSLTCGDGEEKYLSHAGSSRIGPAPDGAGKCRILEEGELHYSFPVPPGAKRLRVTITFGGRGICDAWDKRLFRKKARGDWEERTVILNNADLWAGSRLRLTFTPEKAGSKTILLKKITIKKD